MAGEMAVQWPAIVYPLGAALYVLLIGILEKYAVKRRRLTDEEYLSRMAKMRECSEHDLFVRCAEDWRFSRRKVEDDFKNYLIRGQIPYYVEDFIRKNKKDVDENYRPLLNGGNLPPAWFA